MTRHFLTYHPPLRPNDADRIVQLTYALGLAIGALETVNLQPCDFNKDGLANLLQRLKSIAEAPRVIMGPMPPESDTK